jgi:glutathione synthase/RimK-type ligase-like ATP-grasp enzyme
MLNGERELVILVPDRKVFWVNDPYDLALIELDKPYQLNVASGVGFIVPKTIVTNDPGEAICFAKKNKDLAIKTMGTSKAYFDKETIYHDFTRRISYTDVKKYKDNVKLTPVMMQQYIPKHLELRITVIGSKIFTCAIHSQDSERTKDDWRRYDFENVKHEMFQLPREVERKIFRFMKKLNLQFGAIDMILTPKGEYVFLEINPSGQWGWIEALTGMPIYKSLAELLINPKLAL